ncbi:cardiolipin synthase [Paenibacillus sp. M1]|uniref:Cardiolipin synthase n=1 Tax=Paenibacillus haidiansis TaxID=1574488 RepID=A0ABU7VMW1_9BACL
MLWVILALVLYIVPIAVVVILEYSRPHKAITWIVILLMVPLIGTLLYIFMGKEYKRGRTDDPNELDQLKQVKQRLSDRFRTQRTKEGPAPFDFPEERIYSLLEHSTAIPPAYGNETTVYTEGEDAFADMLRDIESAQSHIHLEFYIIREDALGFRVQQLLYRKAREGVKVRLIYDGIGCHKLSKSYIRRLEEAGVETGCFLPPWLSFFNRSLNYRNHRKIVVVDGKIAYFGGLNIGDEYLGKDPKVGHWRDTHFRIEGDAALWVQYTFLTDWYFVKNELLSDPDFYPLQESKGSECIQIVKSGPDEPIFETVFSCLISAKRRLYIETPYFVLEPAIFLALKTAAASGVDVRVILPANPDSRIVYLASLSFVEELLEAGVRFYLYEQGFIHAKVIIVDDLACSGSANMDIRSFFGQFELNALFFDGKTVDRLVRDFYRDISVSKEIDLARFQKRPQSQKCKEAAARLFSPLF